MADVTVVKADIRPIGDGIDFRAVAGETMTLGQPVYISTAGDPAPTVSLTDTSDATKSFCVGIVIGGGDSDGDVAAGDAITVRSAGLVTGYSTNMAANALFYCDDDAGVIATAAGTKSTIIGRGHSAATLMVDITIVSLS